MLCEKCHQVPAEIFLSEIRDGQITRHNLCGTCGAPLTERLRHEHEDDAAYQAAMAGFPPGSALPIALQALAIAHPPFTPEAYRIILRAVDLAIRATSHHADVSGREIVESFQTLVTAELGGSALATLTSWGLHSTEDIGRAVFQLIDFGILTGTPEDSLSDYDIADRGWKDFVEGKPMPPDPP